MRGRGALLTGLVLVMLAVAPASASALCFGQAATITGSSAGETIPGTAGDDVIEAGAGNDIVNGGTGVDRICGEGDDDTINGQGGDDQLDGGTNTAAGDTVTFVDITVGQGPLLTIDLVAGTAVGSSPISTTDTLIGFENVTGSSTFDDIRGDAGPNVLTGLAAADGFTGRAGDDTFSDNDTPSNQDTALYPDTTGGIQADMAAGTVVTPNMGTDTLVGDIPGVDGTSFDDTFSGDAGFNVFNGFGGDDQFTPLGGQDNINGGAGAADSVTYASEGAFQMDLTDFTSPNVTTATGNDTVFTVENVTGSPQDDTIVAGTESNVIDGLGGSDGLTGGGGGGTDTASFAGLAQGVDANLAGTASGQGSDTLAEFENLTGSSEDDVLIGDANPNVLTGLVGADQITGGNSSDTLALGPGLDVVSANDGLTDSIDCTGGGPDSGTVDTSPAENYTACDTDADSAVDFLDSCPTQAAPTVNGCPVITPPVVTPTPPSAKKKKCKKKTKSGAAAAKKKKCKKKKRK